MAEFGVGSWCWHIKDRVIEWSPELRAMYGMQAGDEPVAGIEYFLNFVHRDDQSRVMAVVSETLSSCRPRHEHHFRLIRRDNEVRKLLSRARLDLASDGTPERLWGIDIDLGPADDCSAVASATPSASRPTTTGIERRSPDELPYRAIIENAAVGIGTFTSNGRGLSANARLCEVTGYSVEELRVMTLEQVVHPDDADFLAAHLEVLRSGATDVCNIELRCVHKDDTAIWVIATLSCVRRNVGTIDYLIVSVTDIRERKLAESRQHTILNELAHRGKNLLAVIQSIANRTLSDERSMAEARDVLRGRLQALSKTYSPLIDETAIGTSLEFILNSELSSFSDRVKIDGPPIILTTKAAQTVALVVHELATNAAKYGALSRQPAGHVDVTWSVEGSKNAAQFEFRWSERNGPLVVAPARSGFGSVLLRDVTASSFLCEPQLDYAQEGFCYRFSAALEHVGSELIESPVRRRLRHDLVCRLFDTWVSRKRSLGDTPDFAGFDWSRFAASGALTIARIDPDSSVHFVRIGQALLERLGRPISELSEGLAENGVDLASVYQTCARKGEPTHEWFQADFGDGEPLTFERLLVPFGAHAGKITHVVGIVVFSGETEGPT